MIIELYFTVHTNCICVNGKKIEELIPKQSVLDYMKNNLFPNFSPLLIMTNYETALRDSLSSSLGVKVSRVLGCWFHHNQFSISASTLTR